MSAAIRSRGLGACDRQKLLRRVPGPRASRPASDSTGSIQISPAAAVRPPTPLRSTPADVSSDSSSLAAPDVWLSGARATPIPISGTGTPDPEKKDRCKRRPPVSLTADSGRKVSPGAETPGRVTCTEPWSSVNRWGVNRLTEGTTDNLFGGFCWSRLLGFDRFTGQGCCQGVRPMFCRRQ